MGNELYFSGKSLDAIHQYACPKIRFFEDWYMRCVDCPGVGDCKVGSRVLVILNEETEPSIQKEIEHKMTYADAFVNAEKSDNPVDYLYSLGHYKTRNSASAAWSKYKAGQYTYQMLINEFGSGRKKGVSVKTMENIRHIFENANSNEIIVRLGEAYPNLNGKDMVKYISRWRTLRPELASEFPFTRVMNAIKNVSGYSHQTMSEIARHIYPGDTDGDDEISVEAMLQEIENSHESNPDPEPLDEDKNDGKSIAYSEVKKRYISLKNERDILEEKIKKLEMDIDILEQALRVL